MNGVWRSYELLCAILESLWQLRSGAAVSFKDACVDVSDCKSVCVKLSLPRLPGPFCTPLPSCCCSWKPQDLLVRARAEDGGDTAGKVDTLAVLDFHRNCMQRQLHLLRFSSLCPQGARSVLAAAVCPVQGREPALCLNIRLSLSDAW